MRPLQELLHRIKWDAEYGKGKFALGYYDRLAHREQLVPFESITFHPDGGGFSLEDETGIVVQIPLHRVRNIYKDGVVIWQRPVRATRK